MRLRLNQKEAVIAVKFLEAKHKKVRQDSHIWKDVSYMSKGILRRDIEGRSMNSCNDCIHYEACVFYCENYNISMYGASPEKCHMFKDKSRIVELPCEIGREVY